MKRIAVFCDGTWNEPKAQAPTNVVKLYNAAKAAEATLGPQKQRAFYFSGVGTSDAQDQAYPVYHPLREFLYRFGGGAFGWGLDAKILEAYSTVIEHYRPGDELYIFGFSRGAYTARSLAGLIRNCGLPDGATQSSLFEAMDVYRARGDDNKPDSERGLRFRRRFSPRFFTSPEDLAARDNPDTCAPIAITYLGVFDTVGALGLPNIFDSIGASFNKKYRFHDTKLSSMVQSARHAVCIDDRRKTFAPTFFDAAKLAQLNAGETNPRYRERWFPGVHGTVGGALLADEDGLGNATMDWIAEGAETASLIPGEGLVFDVGVMDAVRGDISPLSPLRTRTTKPSLVDRLTKRVAPYHREAKPETFDLWDQTERRWREGTDEDGKPYRPKTLRARAQSAGWPE